MSHDRHTKKQSFAPYAALIIVAIVLIAIGNAGALYYTYNQQQDRDQSIINNQVSLISSLSQRYQNSTTFHSSILNTTLEGVKINSLYHGQLMWLIGNNTKTIQENTIKLNTLIDAHNALV